MKRWRPRARGRATRIRKRTCHITIIVSRLPADQLELRRRRMEAVSANRSRRVDASRRRADLSGRLSRRRAAAAEKAAAEEAEAEAAEAEESVADEDVTEDAVTDEATTTEAGPTAAESTTEPSRRRRLGQKSRTASKTTRAKTLRPAPATTRRARTSRWARR